MYQAQLLLKKDNDFSFAKVRERLAPKFPEATWTDGSWSLVMTTSDWEIAFQEVGGPEVLQESQHIAEQITGEEDDQGIGTCERRVELRSDVPDPELEHFEKFQNVLEAMRTFQGTILVDPREPCVL
jgi:hypothetical protein